MYNKHNKYNKRVNSYEKIKFVCMKYVCLYSDFWKLSEKGNYYVILQVLTKICYLLDKIWKGQVIYRQSLSAGLHKYKRQSRQIRRRIPKFLLHWFS